jgi:hypothetical protein
MEYTELKRRCELYFSNKIYTYIKKKDGNYRNGYITKVDKDFFKFMDDEIGEEPILFSEVDKMDVSTKRRKESDGNEQRR